MKTVSFIILILLSLLGYSAGASARAGKSIDLKPQIIDLVLVAFIWSGAIYSRIKFDFNKWLLILLWLICALLIGFVATSFRKLPKEKKSTSQLTGTPGSNFLKKLWQKWQLFSKRMGNFQSRVLLSMFYFIFITPMAVIVKFLSDPLKIKHKNVKSTTSFWLAKKEIKFDLEQYKRQF